jgi:TrmH family RNA methyltransferase
MSFEGKDASAAEHVHVVLVGTTHPGNIGAVARAMKTMGFASLRLVNPKVFPSAEVTALAAGADDVLYATRVFDSLSAAIADCGVVLATSARVRGIPWPELDAEAGAAALVERARQAVHCALVFGRESSGLSNEELELCQGMIRIPANPEFSSLNIASAVQLICYELRKSLHGRVAPADPERVIPPATAEQMERLHEHLAGTLAQIGFLDPDDPRRLPHRLRRLFNRAAPDQNEYNILRGILAAVQRAARRPED